MLHGSVPVNWEVQRMTLWDIYFGLHSRLGGFDIFDLMCDKIFNCLPV